MANDKERYFLVTSGRAGSSLLGAILADAGGDFGMPTPDSWDPTSGQMEHPLSVEAGRLFRRAYYLRKGKRYFLFYKYLIDFRRSRGKKKLRQLLKDTRFVKIASVEMIQHGAKLGHQPRIIAIYRRFPGVARSLFLRRRDMGYDDILDTYCRTNRNALLMLDVYGGCAISFEELVDPRQTSWAAALGAVTGLDRDALLSARDSRVTKSQKKDDRPVNLDAPEADHVFNQLNSLKGLAIAPSKQASRYWS